MTALIILGAVGLGLIAVRVLFARQDAQRDRRRQDALDSLRWPE